MALYFFVSYLSLLLLKCCRFVNKVYLLFRAPFKFIFTQPSSKIEMFLQALHTVSFNWFLFGLEWILNFNVLVTKTFDILPEITCYEISDLGLTLPHFEFLSLYLYYVWSLKLFAQKMKILITYINEGSKCGRVNPRSDIP